MDKSTAEIKQALLEEADRIKEEDIETCRRIGENALMLIGDGSAILTHCNAGRFAAVKYGTALAGIYMAAERIRGDFVICSMTGFGHFEKDALRLDGDDLPVVMSGSEGCGIRPAAAPADSPTPPGSPMP